jgi:release factor glutamine methyltransferase
MEPWQMSGSREAIVLETVLKRATGRLRAAGIEAPALDARILLAAALAIDQAAVLREPARPVTPSEAETLESFLARRAAREPVSRIIGRRWFHEHEFEVGPATLDPRPETETLVDGVLACIDERFGGTKAGLRILDLGTGTGAIIISLLAALPQATGVATDISRGALDIAARNAGAIGVEGRLTLVPASWYEGLQSTFNIIVSNPPYIPTGEIDALEPDVRNYDPLAALDGGADGLEAYREILAGAGAHLKGGGLVVLEVGAGQAGPVATLCKTAGNLVPEADSARWRDLSGHLRCVAAYKPAVT